MAFPILAFLPLITAAMNKKQADDARKVDAREQLHAMRARLAGQLGSPGYGAMGAAQRYGTEQRVDAMNRANTQAMTGAGLSAFTGSQSGSAANDSAAGAPQYTRSPEDDAEVLASRRALEEFLKGQR